MPSTVVHVAFALLCAAGLLGDRFTRRAALAVAAATVVPDLDVFASLVVESTHRAALHSVWLPGAAALGVWVDSRRDTSWLHARFGADAVAVAWVALFGYVVAGIGLDAFTALGVNPLYPVVDQFVAIDGRTGYSTAEGLFQTFVEVAEDQTTSGETTSSVDLGQRGSTEDVHVASGVDPDPGKEAADTERVFPVVFRGWHVTLILAGALATWGRLRESHPLGPHSDD